MSSQGGPEQAPLTIFKDEVENTTQGAVRIELHHGGSLGSPSTTLETMMAGELDLFSGDMHFLLPLMIDEVTGLELSFLLTDNAPAQHYLAPPLFAEVVALGVTVTDIDWSSSAAALEQHSFDGVVAPDLASLLAAQVDLTRDLAALRADGTVKPIMIDPLDARDRLRAAYVELLSEGALTVRVRSTGREQPRQVDRSGSLAATEQVEIADPAPNAVA